MWSVLFMDLDKEEDMLQKDVGGMISIDAFHLSHDGNMRLDIIVTVDDWKKNIQCPCRVRIPGQPEWQLNVMMTRCLGTEEDFGQDTETREIVVDYSEVLLYLRLSLSDGSNQPIKIDAPICVSPGQPPLVHWDVIPQSDESIVVSGKLGGVFETSLELHYSIVTPVLA